MPDAPPNLVSPGDAPSPLDRLLGVLELEQIEANMFRGFSPPETKVRVFGGQVAAQALLAAIRTVEPDKSVHSLHAYFLRTGDPARPIVYDVDRIRDGRSFSTRRVVGIQAGRAIFNLQASFQVHEVGYEHQLAPADPPVPGPDSFEVATSEWDPGEDDERSTDFLLAVQPILARLVPSDDPYRRRVWFRANGHMSDDPVMHQVVFTYASDITLLGASLGPHQSGGVGVAGFVASLDHAMWFQRPFRADEWLLYDQETPSATSGRGLARGRVYTGEGVLAASVVQEGVIRPPH